MQKENGKQSVRNAVLGHSVSALVLIKTPSVQVPANRGFSLVELMVTITIFIMITSITMTNYPRFSNKLSLDLLAQDVALSLRQAQISGSSVLGVRSGLGQPRMFGAYGAHFEAPDYVNYPGKYLYVLYADINPPSVGGKPAGDRHYTGQSTVDPNMPDTSCPGPTLNPSVNECLQKFLITGFNQVKYLCANFINKNLPSDTDWVTNCAKDPMAWLDVEFVRPNLDALFYVKRNSSDLSPVAGVSNVGIVLESPGGSYYKTIVVWKTGQISVE